MFSFPPLLLQITNQFYSQYTDVRGPQKKASEGDVFTSIRSPFCLLGSFFQSWSDVIFWKESVWHVSSARVAPLILKSHSLGEIYETWLISGKLGEICVCFGKINHCRVLSQCLLYRADWYKVSDLNSRTRIPPSHATGQDLYIISKVPMAYYEVVHLQLCVQIII